jgi:hypothetical protein
VLTTIANQTASGRHGNSRGSCWTWTAW